jgi:hypothetical protein
MRILVALLSILAGLSLVFGGYRLARVLIPLMGFIAGLTLGGAIVTDAAGSSFLGTFLGVVIGIISGAVLALLAYLYYSLAVIVLTASLGYWAGSGIILLLGFRPGLLSALVGIALGIFTGILALISNAPKYVLIVLTSLAGSVATVGGVLLLFNQLPLDTFSYTTAAVALSNSFFWAIAALALLIAGMIEQAQSTKAYELEAWTASDHGVPPTTTQHPRSAH